MLLGTSVTEEHPQRTSKTVFLLSSQIHANCRIRRVYFSDRLYSEDELPAEFKLYLPVQNQKAKVKHTSAHTNKHAFTVIHYILFSYVTVMPHMGILYLCEDNCESNKRFRKQIFTSLSDTHLFVSCSSRDSTCNPPPPPSPDLMWSLAVRFSVCRHTMNFKTL